MATSSNLYTKRFLSTTSCQCIGDEDFVLIVWPKENNYSILKKSKCPKEDENCMIKYKERNTVHTGFIFREGKKDKIESAAKSLNKALNTDVESDFEVQGSQQISKKTLLLAAKPDAIANLAVSGSGSYVTGSEAKTISSLKDISFTRKQNSGYNASTSSLTIDKHGDKEDRRNQPSTSTTESTLDELDAIMQEPSTSKNNRQSDSKLESEFSDKDDGEELDLQKTKSGGKQKRNTSSGGERKRLKPIRTATRTTTINLSPSRSALAGKPILPGESVNEQILKKIHLATSESNNDIQRKLNQILVSLKKHDKMFEMLFKNQSKIQKSFSHRHVHIPLQVPEREEEEVRQDNSEESFESVLVYEREDESINLLSLEADINYLNLFVTLLMDVIYKNADEVINLDPSTIAQDQGYQLIKGK
ncbi:unnamed protein product [Didymodactylos carnosus]|uniref:Uncharacterized protein n=1 Tax=Didymodactylos carnosus TaxID=1234261 RepID=A0A8S2DMW9_9BILA|nr:unnamed protein product [Didymodactylos carnosus]CAF3707845.1 unnamed protein product [Didymodactylos carnosus]